MSFVSLGLSDPIARAVQKSGYEKPTPIQSKAIPVVLSGKDILARAQTGTGKTAAFVLPILQKLSEKAAPAADQVRARPIRALILTPTRELAAQVDASIKVYSTYLSLKSLAIFGGVNIVGQMQNLKRGFDILVATPGRLLDHVNRKTVNLSKVEMIVLDEADRMLDMGFIRDIREIIQLLPKQRQNLLFSATYSSEVKSLADGLLHNPVTVEVEHSQSTAQRIEQWMCWIDKSRKSPLLSFLIGSQNWKQVLVFVRTRHGADRLAKQLSQSGLHAIAIHGDKTQGARTRALAEFKSGKISILVATDIAARGLDINHLPYVVNFDLPNVPEDYVHRIGRTGRAGREGIAISLVSSDERQELKSIERLLKAKIPQKVIEGFDANFKIPAATEDDDERPKSKRSSPAGKRFSAGSKSSSSRGGERSGFGSRAPRSEGSRAGGAKRFGSSSPRGGERSEFAPRASRSSGERSEFAPRASRSSGERSEFAPRGPRSEASRTGGAKRFGASASRGERSEFAPRASRSSGERSEFTSRAPRSEGSRTGGAKRFGASAPRGERSEFAPRAPRSEGSRTGGAKRFGASAPRGERSEFAPRGPRSEASRTGGAKRFGASASRGERSEFAPRASRSSGERSEFTSRAPRSDGSRAPAGKRFGSSSTSASRGGERSEFGARSRSEGARPSGGAKRFGSAGAKPAARAGGAARPAFRPSAKPRGSAAPRHRDR